MNPTPPLTQADLAAALQQIARIVEDSEGRMQAGTHRLVQQSEQRVLDRTQGLLQQSEHLVLDRTQGLLQQSEHLVLERMQGLLQQSEHLVLERMQGLLQQLEQRVLERVLERVQGFLQLSEQRILDRTQEMVRDAQTELLRGFAAHATSYDLRLRKVQADISNLTTAETLRLDNLESRVTALEIKQLGGPPLPDATTGQ